ncbi:MAG: metallophosphatase domain-containing protein [Pseudomonadota bacterium]
MKIVIISDTHERHENLGAIDGDVLIHCGDLFNLRSDDSTQLKRVDDWFGRQEFDVILLTGGNHDLLLERKLLKRSQPFENAVFLKDMVHWHNGVCFYGAPWVPLLTRHAFYADDSELRNRWARIPQETNVLITHIPPYSVMDRSSRGMELGCRHLAEAVQRVKPVVHCFGHVHHSAGVVQGSDTLFVNASSVNSQLEVVHAPVVLEL